MQTGQWHKLDNAAKLFATTSSAKDPRVFRFVCELYDDVDPLILQRALDVVIERYKIYTSILKKGMFWYYFEQTDLRPKVMPEYKTPCSVIYNEDVKGLLFEVTYHKKRINLEVFHALMDGTGARNFLCDIVRFYIIERYGNDIEPPIPKLNKPASETQQADDSFSRYSQKLTSYYKTPNRMAYKIRSDRLDNNLLGVIEAHFSLKSLLETAHKYGATITEYLSAVMILSINDTMSKREEDMPVVLTVPINLRTYFPSESARNFFGIVNITYDFKKSPNNIESVIEETKKQLEAQMDIAELQLRINRLTALENHIAAKVMPLAIKNPFMRLGNAYAEKKATAAVSNIGRIALEDKLAPFVRRFVFYTSTKTVQACICSFGDVLSVGFSSNFIRTDIQRNFVRRLSEVGIHADIVTNLGD